MKPNNRTNSLKLSYVFKESKKLLYLKSIVKIIVTPGTTYEKKLVNVNGEKIRIVYEEKDSNQQTGTIFTHTVLVWLNIRIPQMDTYTTNILRTAITNHLNHQGENFEVNAIFQKPEGTLIGTLGGYISDDADIDFY